MGEKLTIDEIQRIIEHEGQGTIELLQDGTVRRRSVEEMKQFQEAETERKRQAESAALGRHFIEELLDPRVSKTEREHAAVRLIAEFASRLKKAKAALKDVKQERDTAVKAILDLCDQCWEDSGHECIGKTCPAVPYRGCCPQKTEMEGRIDG